MSYNFVLNEKSKQTAHETTVRQRFIAPPAEEASDENQQKLLESRKQPN